MPLEKDVHSYLYIELAGSGFAPFNLFGWTIEDIFFTPIKNKKYKKGHIGMSEEYLGRH